RRQGGGRVAPGLVQAAADFDGDGRTDLAAVSPDGVVHLLLNRTATRNQWIRVSLEGVKNLKLAQGAEIEVKAGAAYQKRLYEAPAVVFGLGAYREADAVRITWPNGTIQNETRRPAGRTDAYKEAPRLAGSCPMVFTWNGRRMQFITDVLGVAPLGASAGETGYFPLDNDEYVHVPPGALVPQNGRYDVRITEELREVSYLDQVQLVAVDRPAGDEIFTNEKFKSPPFPEFRLFGVKRRLYPVRATDHRGRDVLQRVLRKDRVYPSAFRRDYAGVAELHTLDLDFGPAAARENRALLVLGGWVDWADGSTFLGAAQTPGGGLIMPYLQVKDSAGAWQTVMNDMGMPAGKTKTIVVDLTGKFLSASREVRIVTNLCVYWDEIFLSEDTAPPAVRQTTLDAAEAGLRFRGFSRPIVHPRREQPEEFDYARVSPVSQWNPTPGLYTRYGDVRELVATVDDRFVILGSGDELHLSFDAAALPPLPAGWARDFLLRVDGWSKDGDANTAHSGSVEPLPFHAMSGYPYRASEHYPDDHLHRTYLATYNTRKPKPGTVHSIHQFRARGAGENGVLSVLSPVYGRGVERFPGGAALSSAPPGFFASADPEVSFDAERLLFAGKRRKDDPWQIWEMPLAGGAPRQITRGPEDCIRPLYLPGDELVYARKHGGAFQIEAAHFSGGEPTRLTWAPGSFLPSQILRDGRILFEGPHPESGTDLFTMFSDGSGVEALRCDHGPSRREGRQLASGDIVFVAGHGLARITPALAKAVEMRSPQGEIAGPVAEIQPGEWLISIKPPGSPIFLLHRWKPESSARPVVVERSRLNAVQPVVVAPRPVPPIHPSGLHGKPGANLLCLNAYESPLKFAAGSIASVRVYSQDARGAAVKLGEAPVESDGSFYVQLPTERPIRLELADRQGQPLAAEKGWFWMRHGEQRICVGCHAGPERAPENAVPRVLQRSAVPVRIEP
ncbi:MAG: ASPIC/UnbV domain-containing protein, partial [Acidobacteria bacterium]|nr:ASPIC/UnbV domain-containing protein [Acidobacteriota bacterium]